MIDASVMPTMVCCRMGSDARSVVDAQLRVRAKRVGLGLGATSLAEARSNALAQCGDADCKVTREFTEPGFIAIARTKNEQSDPYFHVAYGGVNSDVADKDAAQGCARNAKEDCRVVWSGAIRGPIAAAAPAPRPQPVAAAKSCRPNTPTVRCSSHCINGDCTVTYENGCKMRVQVNAEFDPFSKQWKYPPPSC